MTFLRSPTKGLTDNAKLDPEQKAIAAEFVDELISLGVLVKAPPDDPLHANCPLFVVPKPGQPGQWRVIADCKKVVKMRLWDRDQFSYPKPPSSFNKCIQGAGQL